MSAPLFAFYDCKDSGVVEIVWCVLLCFGTLGGKCADQQPFRPLL